MTENKTALFERYPIPKAVAVLAVPAVFSSLVMVLYNIADTFFVGMLGNPVQSAAVSLAAPALLAFNAVTNLFGTGAASLMSRALGKKDTETAKRTAAFSFYSALLCAVLISVGYSCFKVKVIALLGADSVTSGETERYLFWTVSCGAVPAILNVVLSGMVRSEGESAYAGIGVISGCILNIIIDPFFILPRFLGLGAAGAGLATFISNSFAMVFFFLLIYKKRKTTIVCLVPQMAGFTKNIFSEVFSVGVPASIQNLLNVAGSIVLNNYTSEFGADAVSAMGISHKINLMPLYITMGITQGIMPLIGYNYTSGNRKRMKDAILFVLKITVVVTVILAIVFFCCSEKMIRLFIDSDGVVLHGKLLLKAMSIGIPFLATDFLVVAVFQATGKGIYSLIFAISRKIVLEIPAIIIFNKIYPLYGMGFSQSAAEFILSGVSIIFLCRILKEKTEVSLQTGRND